VNWILDFWDPRSERWKEAKKEKMKGPAVCLGIKSGLAAQENTKREETIRLITAFGMDIRHVTNLRRLGPHGQCPVLPGGVQTWRVSPRVAVNIWQLPYQKENNYALMVRLNVPSAKIDKEQASCSKG
jgi:hypothetical protein